MLPPATGPTSTTFPPPAPPHIRSRGAPVQGTTARFARALQGVLNMPVDAKAALPLATATGAVAGAAVAALAGGDLLSGTLVGAGLGLSGQLVAHDVHWRHGTYLRQWEALQRYPTTREVMAGQGITIEHMAEVMAMHAESRLAVAAMQGGFTAYCERFNMACEPRALALIEQFCLAHWARHELLMSLEKDEKRFFVAAIRSGDYDQMVARIRDSGQSARVEFQRSGIAFLTARLHPGARPEEARWQLGQYAGRAATWREDLPAHAAGTTAGEPVAACYQPAAEPLVSVARRRLGRGAVRARRGLATRAMPPASSLTATPPRPLYRSAVFERQRGLLEHDDATFRRLATIEEDLARGRDAGHAIRELHCRAIDVSIGGFAGRNVWRLFYRPTGEGIELIGIGDYHQGSAQPVRWWQG